MSIRPTTKHRASEEISLINMFFRDYRIAATVSGQRSYVAGKSFIVLAIALGPGTRISSIELRLRELAEILSDFRGEAAPVRLRHLPLALELPHPALEALALPANMTLEPHTMALGASYGFAGERVETIALNQTPHVLVAGTTGSGKSTLLSAMLYTLTRNTSPADLQLILVDLKNEDLQPFVGLPHVQFQAMTTEDALDAVQRVCDEKDRRVRAGRQPHQRLVLVIDELAELGRLKGINRQLASVLAIGRSKAINVVAATQLPMASLIGGSASKANFTLRLIGRMLSADDAKAAAGQAATGAEYLPGRGSFLRIDGAEVSRFQAYWFEDIEQRMEQVRQRWFEQLPLPIENWPARQPSYRPEQ